MAERYYHKRGDQIRGPFTIEKLRDLQAEGKLRPSDRLSVRDDGGWRSVEETITAPKPRKAGSKQSSVAAKLSARTVMIPVGAVILALLAVVGWWRFAGSPPEQPKASTPVSNVSASTRTEIPVLAMARPPEAVVPFSEEQAKLHQSDWANYLGVPVEWSNSIGMKFRLIPPGKFVWPPGQPKEFVLADPYYLGVTEVTVGEFGEVMDFVFAEDKRHFPRADITAPEAVEFCVRLSAIEALKPGYRLAACPESEFAALGGREAKWSPTDEEYGKIAWFDKNWDKEYHPVAKKLPSPFGIFDLYGNVWEFCDDTGGFRGLAAGNVAPSQYPSRFLSNYRFVNGLDFKERGVGFRVAIGLNAEDLKPSANAPPFFAGNPKDRGDAKPLPPVSVLRRAIEAYAIRDRAKVQRLASEADVARKTTEDDETFRKVRHLLKLVEPPALRRLQDLPATMSKCLVSDLIMDVEEGNLLLRNRSFTESPTASPLLTVAGQFFESGIFAHANSRLVLRLNGGWETFTTQYGIQDRSAESSVVFVVKGDGKELFRSSTVKAKTLGDISVAVRGMNDLELITETTPDGNRYDWSVWLEPTLHRNSQPSTSGTATSQMSPNSKSPASSIHSESDGTKNWGPAFADVYKVQLNNSSASIVKIGTNRAGTTQLSFTIPSEWASAGKKLTNDELLAISRLTGSVELNLDNISAYSELELAQLGQCQGLEILTFRCDHDRNVGFLASLASLQNLQWLIASGEGIADPCTLHMKNLSHLTYLGMRDTKVTDSGIRVLVGIPSLEQLFLVNSQIRGDGFAAFKDHGRLRHIRLANCSLLDEKSILSLTSIASLERMDCFDTNLSQKAAAKLKKARTNLAVEITGADSENWVDRFLRSSIPNLEFPGVTPLRDVLDFVEDWHSETTPNQKLVFEWKSVEGKPNQGEVDPLSEMHVHDLNLKNMSFREAITKILASVKDQKLTFQVSGSRIIISPESSR